MNEVNCEKDMAKESALIIDVLSAAVEFKSFLSGRHIARVRAVTEIMMQTWAELYPEDGLDRETIRRVTLAATLYDIGKVAIPDNILLKPGRLTREEFAIMKTHTLRGCELLERFKQTDSDFYRYCYDICRYHHERSDGSGYPDGLTEDAIPIWAQVISVVDVFDALISPRVYKAPYSTGTAIEMIQNGECGAFSAKLMRCFDVAKEAILKSVTTA